VTEQQKLIEKLRKIETLFAGTTFAGEKDAASDAIDRIRQKLQSLEDTDPPIEYRFTMEDMWSRKLFVALLRRYGLTPYRYYRQRYTTVMTRVSKSFVDETLWPEFNQLDDVLRSYLEEVTHKVISESVYPDHSDAEVRNDAAKMLPRE
jgi:hypothetical protein